jgi:TFIIF-interacting CTD phosphatase-like protein
MNTLDTLPKYSPRSSSLSPPQRHSPRSLYPSAPYQTNRRNVVLDLDNTLISAEAMSDFPFEQEGIRDKAIKFSIHDMDGYYIIFERPDVQEFLDYLFENFDVSIWTAASKDYALFIIKNIILTKPNRKLKYILFSYHCDISKKFYKKKSKKLDLMWDFFSLDGFLSDNTIIIDDLKEVHDTQPNNCIHIKAWEILDNDSDKDNELMTTVKDRLEELRLN